MCVVRDFSRLSYSECDTKSKRKRYHCTNCHTQFFYSEDKLKFHRELCLKNEVQMCTMPKPGTILKFRNFRNMIFVPIAIYSDFECYQDVKHTPSGFGMYVKSIDDNIYKSRYISKTFKGDVAKEYINQVLEIREEIDRIPVKNMELTDDDTSYHMMENRCWICEDLIDESPTVTKKKDATEKKDISNTKVRDHCHFTGKYRGPAHSRCNLQLKRSKFVPFIFHNLKGYDSHFLVGAFRGLSEDIGGIPESGQKFKTLSLKKKSIKLDDGTTKYFSTVKFFDSFEFKKKGLCKLTKEIKDYPILDTEFPPGQAMDLKRKGVFPYEWFDTFGKLSHTKFPPHEAFRSRLMGFEENENGIIVGKNISKDEYEHGRSVFEKYCGDMGDYHNLYMKGDVALLADVFENFRRDAYNNFNLDPLNYITLASFAWDCVLKFTKVRLELLSDMDMYNFFDQGIRGGYSNCHKNYSKANHKYLPDFDPNNPSIFIVYWDINSMYASAMTKKLPYGNFKWLSESECDNIMDLISQGRHHEIPACTLMVNLKHDVKNIEMEKIFGMCPVIFEDKLCHTLYDKEDYIIHHRALKKHIDYGMVVTKVRRVISYEEKAWMKEYIEFCVEKRKEAKRNGVDSLVEFWKSMMNEPYGKTMENVRDRVKFELVSDREKIRKNF